MTALTIVTVHIDTKRFTVGGGLPRGVLRISLTKPDIDGAIIVPGVIDVPLDANGIADPAMWSNTRGTQGSQYNFIGVDRNGTKQFEFKATVPATACNLHEILSLAAPATVDDATAASLAAQGYAATSKEWATKTSGEVVTGQGYGAKKYAQDAAASAEAAAAILGGIGATTDDLPEGVTNLYYTDARVAAGYQPLDSDLTAIAALSTTSYGRAFLALADAAAGRTALALGTAAVAATGDFDAAGAAAAAQSAAIAAAASDATTKANAAAAASQPVDSDLTAIAALTTTTFGRALLALADAAALRTAAGLGGAAVLAVGTSAGTVAAGDDSRLADARTPTAHKASHATGGGDALAASDIGAQPETGATIAALHHAASVKSALVDADEVTGGDSAAAFGLIRTTWTSVKAFLKTYFDGIYAALAVAQTFTKAQRGAFVTLTDASTIALDLSLANQYKLVLGGNRTLDVPSSIVEGQQGVISIRQDATGSRTLAYAWPYEWAGGTVGQLSIPGCSRDLLAYSVDKYNSAVVTITLATPGVVSMTGHGFASGQRCQIATTGALPTGLATGTTYFVSVVDADSFKLCTTLANAAAGTFIATSGSQSGVHTLTGCSISLQLGKAFA